MIPSEKNSFGSNLYPFQEKTKFSSAPGLLLMDDNQPSPVPILEASFSNDYYSYGSRRAYSGLKIW